MTSEPQWVARNGEFTFLQSSSQNRIYFYANNQWNWLGGGANGAAAAGTQGDVQINSSNTFGVARANTFNYNIGSSRLVVYRSMFINTNTNNWMSNFNDGDPALFVVGNNASAGTVHMIVRDSSNTRNIFEVQDTRIFMGYGRGVGLTDANIDVYVDGEQGYLHLAGRHSESSPCALRFNDRANSSTHTYRLVGQFYLNTGLPDQSASTINGTGGYVTFSAANMPNLSRENPSFQFSRGDRTFVGSIINQRFIYISSSPVYGAGNTIKNVSNCATVYIEGAPVAEISQISSSSILNNYALWVDQGVARFDGVSSGAVMELPADATDPTGGGGAATGRIPVIIGGTTRFLAYY